MPPTASGLFEREPRGKVIADLVRRSRVRLEPLAEPALRDVLEDALYAERQRLEKADAKPGEEERLDRLARALVRGSARERVDASLALVGGWSDEIHGRFSPRAYSLATRSLPALLMGLLAGKPKRLRDWDLSTETHLKVEGDLDFLRELEREATLILVPTHVSNLDSPLIGLALYQAGLPPFSYGAGLNLFSNPVMGWWLRRLGAYTVDRRKRAILYKDVLKDYSVRCLTTRRHSLFFPGGTRSRSGVVETSIKKGLLGTGIVAWQEMLQAGRSDSEVYVVPLTLSFSLCLEAPSLIQDHLAEAGKQRFIIADDEFAQPREVASFVRRMLDLDDPVVARFLPPLDLLGHPVPRDPAERAAEAVRRRRYVTTRDGEVEIDPQRDHLYTNRLAEAIVEAYPRGATVMPTHLAAWVGWSFLEEARGTRDPFRLVRIDPAARHVPRASFEARTARVMEQVRAGAQAGKWHADLPNTATQLVDLATDRFARFHKTRALALDGSDVVVRDPQLCLYYRNRLLFAGLEVA